MTRRLLFPSTFHLLLSILCLASLSGCALIGVGAQALPPPIVQAQYKKLAGERVGVMVWADRGMRIEWEFLQLDLANAIQSRLQETSAPKDKNRKLKPGETPKAAVKELQGTTYPVLPRSILRFQQEHPEIDGQSITEVAPRLGGLSRLIYVEVEDFTTRPDGGVELYRGDAKVTLRVVEINPADGTAKVAYEENDVTASWPPSAPKEGRPSIGDRRTYVELVKELGTEICKRFVPHEEEDR